MELSIIFLPLIASIISGFFGKNIGQKKFLSKSLKKYNYKFDYYFHIKHEQLIY